MAIFFTDGGGGILRNISSHKFAKTFSYISHYFSLIHFNKKKNYSWHFKKKHTKTARQFYYLFFFLQMFYKLI